MVEILYQGQKILVNVIPKKKWLQRDLNQN